MTIAIGLLAICLFGFSIEALLVQRACKAERAVTVERLTHITPTMSVTKVRSLLEAGANSGVLLPTLTHSDVETVCNTCKLP